MVAEYDDLTFERLGHASVRIESPNETVYVDPWTEVLDSEPSDGDVVFVTHDDFDHFDADAITTVIAPDGTVAAYEGVDTSALEQGVVELPHSGTVTVDGVSVETIPAYNDPDGPHVDNAGDPFHAEGDGIGLYLTLNGTTVLVPSDTDFLDHHSSLTADVLVPPIGGCYTMDRHEAAAFARAIEPDLVLPVHYDTFEAIETDAAQFAEELKAEGIRTELF